MSDDKPRVSLQRICQALKLTSRRVQQLISDGTLPKPDGTTKNAKYDLLETIWAYYAWKEKTAVNKAAQKNAHRSKTEDDIKQVELQLKQFKLEQEKGLWIHREEVVNELVRRAHVLKSDLLSLVRRMPAGSREKETVKKFVMTLLKNYSQKTGPFKHDR
jgi:hypothetical protein